MKNKTLIALIALLSLFTVSCDSNDSNDSDNGSSLSQEERMRMFTEEANIGNNQSNQNPQNDTNDSVPQGGGGFLWKPVSESTGKLVILTPFSSTHGKTEGYATISGSFGTERANMRGEDGNGNRPHFYFSQPGAAYGTDITVQVPLIDGSIYSQSVSNGASRTE